MIELRTPPMVRFLQRGLRKARRRKPPPEGYLDNLVYKTLPNGWHYQVEYIHDLRVMPKPYVVVYAFKPPRVMWAKAADYFLYEQMERP